jgi:hypothetical protein
MKRKERRCLLEPINRRRIRIVVLWHLRIREIGQCGLRSAILVEMLSQMVEPYSEVAITSIIVCQPHFCPPLSLSKSHTFASVVE